MLKIFLICLLLHHLEGFESFGNENRLLMGYTAITIYSQCSNATYQTPINNLAANTKTTESLMFPMDVLPTQHTEYEDICNDTQILLHVLVDMLLDQKYFFQPDEINKNISVWREQNILSIIALVPDDMSKLIEQVFSFTDTFKVCGPRNCDKRLNLNPVDDQVVELKELLEDWQWHDVTFVHAGERKPVTAYWDQYWDKSIEILKESKEFCIQAKRFGEYHFHESDKKIWQVYFTRFIPNSTTIIFNGRYNVLYSMREFFLSSFKETPMIIPFKPERYTALEDYADIVEQLPWVSNYHAMKDTSNIYNNVAIQYKDAVISYIYTGYDERESLRKALDVVIPHIGHSYVVPYFHNSSHIYYEEQYL